MQREATKDHLFDPSLLRLPSVLNLLRSRDSLEEDDLRRRREERSKLFVRALSARTVETSFGAEEGGEENASEGRGGGVGGRGEKGEKGGGDGLKGGLTGGELAEVLSTERKGG